MRSFSLVYVEFFGLFYTQIIWLFPQTLFRVYFYLIYQIPILTLLSSLRKYTRILPDRWPSFLILFFKTKLHKYPFGWLKLSMLSLRSHVSHKFSVKGFIRHLFFWQAIPHPVILRAQHSTDKYCYFLTLPTFCRN